MRYWIWPCLLLVMQGCTWVKLTPAGAGVKVATADAVAQCKKVGYTETTLTDKVAGLQRNRDKVKQEMETLARNSGAKLKGDTVVAVSNIVNGSQTFDVYVCTATVKE